MQRIYQERYTLKMDVSWHARRSSNTSLPCTVALNGLLGTGVSAKVSVYLDPINTCEWTENLSLFESVILLQLCRRKGPGSRAVAPATKLGILFVWIAHPGVPNPQLNSCGLLMENRWVRFMEIQTGVMWCIFSLLHCCKIPWIFILSYWKYPHFSPVILVIWIISVVGIYKLTTSPKHNTIVCYVLFTTNSEFEAYGRLIF